LSLTSSSGPYTIQQVSAGRYLDAHVTSAGGFRVVTQDPTVLNENQEWRINDEELVAE
jgi:hypothetical protein